MCSELGLIDPALAEGAADAYRLMRKLQHQVRLQGQENARVDPALVAAPADVVVRLWRACFGG
jgi:glutamate-ammonia-ligase adenylyltransferase